MPKINRQSLLNKTGEVKFRQKLVKQHTADVITSPHEPNFAQNIVEIKNRLKRLNAKLVELKKRGVILSPFLEVAGGQGYRSDFIVSRYNASGISSDISQHSLASSQIINKKFKLNKQSLKICCDAYKLPFLSNSFPFAFIALSLHHFPDPQPIINEIARILSPQGHFYFDEEPIKQGLNLNLWRRDYNLRWYEKILKYFVVLIWLSRIGKAEVDEGILEETFSLETWEKSLSAFDEVEVYQTVFPFPWQFTLKKSDKKGWIKPNWILRLGLWLFGGGIGGIAKINKAGIFHKKRKNIWSFLGCPSCRKQDRLYPLQKVSQTLVCRWCKTVYKKKGGVWMILPKKLLKHLYG